MASAPKRSDSQTKEDPLDVLLAELLAASEKGGDKPTPAGSSSRPADRRIDEGDPWQSLSDQVNDEISRQIFDDLDKQLDAQMMAELEKCQEEQSRRIDDELDRQIQEQLDAMLNASLRSELRNDERDGYDYYSDDDEYSSDEQEYELEKLPWSEGGEGGIGSLGLGELSLDDGAGRSSRGMVIGAPQYSHDELQKMVDNLFGPECTGENILPGAWGRGRWRPTGEDSG